MSDMLFGTIITKNSYQDGEIVSTKLEKEVSIFTDRNNLLADVIDSLAVISKGETTKLDLTIQMDKKGRIRLVRKWSV